MKYIKNVIALLFVAVFVFIQCPTLLIIAATNDKEEVDYTKIQKRHLSKLNENRDLDLDYEASLVRKLYSISKTGIMSPTYVKDDRSHETVDTNLETYTELVVKELETANTNLEKAIDVVKNANKSDTEEELTKKIDANDNVRQCKNEIRLKNNKIALAEQLRYISMLFTYKVALVKEKDLSKKQFSYAFYREIYRIQSEIIKNKIAILESDKSVLESTYNAAVEVSNKKDSVVKARIEAARIQITNGNVELLRLKTLRPEGKILELKTDRTLYKSCFSNDGNQKLLMKSWIEINKELTDKSTHYEVNTAGTAFIAKTRNGTDADKFDSLAVRDGSDNSGTQTYTAINAKFGVGGTLKEKADIYEKELAQKREIATGKSTLTTDAPDELAAYIPYNKKNEEINTLISLDTFDKEAELVEASMKKRRGFDTTVMVDWSIEDLDKKLGLNIFDSMQTTVTHVFNTKFDFNGGIGEEGAKFVIAQDTFFMNPNLSTNIKHLIVMSEIIPVLLEINTDLNISSGFDGFLFKHETAIGIRPISDELLLESLHFDIGMKNIVNSKKEYDTFGMTLFLKPGISNNVKTTIGNFAYDTNFKFYIPCIRTLDMKPEMKTNFATKFSSMFNYGINFIDNQASFMFNFVVETFVNEKINDFVAQSIDNAFIPMLGFGGDTHDQVETLQSGMSTMQTGVELTYLIHDIFIIKTFGKIGQNYNESYFKTSDNKTFGHLNGCIGIGLGINMLGGSMAELKFAVPILKNSEFFNGFKELNFNQFSFFITPNFFNN